MEIFIFRNILSHGGKLRDAPPSSRAEGVDTEDLILAGVDVT